jgi:hypothetical protein
MIRGRKPEWPAATAKRRAGTIPNDRNDDERLAHRERDGPDGRFLH